MNLRTKIESAWKYVTGGRNAEIVEKVIGNIDKKPREESPEAKLLAEQIAAASASLTNPEIRVELPADFPALLNGYQGKELIEGLKTALAKHGTSLEEAGHINIAYPHKDPGLYPTHENAASSQVLDLVSRLSGEKPEIGWVPVDGLVERVRLGRSEDQTSVHALSAKQEFGIYAPAQKTPLPFGAADGKKEFFVIIDSGAEQGTTYANLISYIRHNGGTVLAAIGAYSGGENLRQIAPDNDAELRKQADLKPEFNDVSRNTGQLARMALAFSDSARESGKDWTPAQSLEMFEEKLRALGNTVFAMTNGEVDRLVKTVNKKYYKPATFVEILDQLDKKIEAKNAPPVEVKPVLPALQPLPAGIG